MADFYKTNFKAQTPREESLDNIFNLLTPEEKVQYAQNFQPTIKERLLIGAGGIGDVIERAGGNKNNYASSMKDMQNRSDSRIGQDMQFVGNELTRKYAERQAKAAAEKANKEGTAFKGILDNKYQELGDPNLTSENAWDYYKTMLGDERMRYLNAENAATRRALGGSKRADKEDDSIDKLRKELLIGPHAKNRNFLNAVKRGQLAIREFSKNPTGYSDYSTLMMGLKGLQGDDSVVRESEVRLGQNAGSLNQKIQNWSDKLASGKSLQPKQREDIINTLQTLVGSAQDIYSSGINPVYERAKAKGLPLDQIFETSDLDFIKNRSQGISDGPEVLKKGYNSKTDETQILYKDGTKKIVKGRQ